MDATSYVEQAQEIAALPREEQSNEMQSRLATFEAKVEQGDDRAANAWARVIVKLAASEEPDEDDDADERPTTVKAMQAEIAARNEGRDEADLIKPASKSKADLQAALDADDAKD